MAWRTMDPTMMAWMMAGCIALIVLLVYFAYRYGRMAQRLDDVERKP